jgi:uncharacterized protein YbjT (DUF2867 family)
VELRARGHRVRGTTRRESILAQIEAVGAEPVLADPGRIGTVAPALAQVSVVCVLLGGANGPPAEVQALHGPRLEMLLTRALDTTVRGVVYEAAGSVPDQLLRSGAELVGAFCERSLMPFALIDRDPADGYREWTEAAVAGFERAIG